MHLAEDLDGADERALAANFSAAYAAFATSGDPGWPRFSDDAAGLSRVFNLSKHLAVATGWDASVCDGFWTPFNDYRMVHLPPAPPMNASLGRGNSSMYTRLRGLAGARRPPASQRRPRARAADEMVEQQVE